MTHYIKPHATRKQPTCGIWPVVHMLDDQLHKEEAAAEKTRDPELRAAINTLADSIAEATRILVASASSQTKTQVARTITTVEQLDALQAGSILVDPDGMPWVTAEGDDELVMLLPGSRLWFPPLLVIHDHAPLTLIWTPEATA